MVVVTGLLMGVFSGCFILNAVTVIITTAIKINDRTTTLLAIADLTRGSTVGPVWIILLYLSGVEVGF